MVQPNWSLLQMNGPMGGFQNALAQGYQIGADAKAQREETERKNALSGYVTNPTDETFGALAQAAPEYAMQVGQQRQAQQREAQINERTAAAMNGDQDSRQWLLRNAYERWQDLDERQQTEIAEQEKVRGGVARYALNNNDPRAVVRDYVRTSGDQEAAALLEMNDSEFSAALRQQVFNADLVGDMLKDERPDWTVYDR